MALNDEHAFQSHWRSAGFWMAVAMALLQAAYALLAFGDPAGFASYRGTPLASSGDAGWVSIYASRTLFIALVIGLLLLRGDLQALQWVALLGILMPATDAALALRDMGPPAVVVRHLATIAFLLGAFFMLGRWTQRHRVGSRSRLSPINRLRNTRPSAPADDSEGASGEACPMPGQTGRGTKG